MLQYIEVLSDLHRVIGRDQRGGCRQDQALGLRRDVPEQRGRRRRNERRVVVLTGREHVQADFLDLLRDRHGGFDPLGLGRRPAGRRIRRHVTDSEDPELHARHRGPSRHVKNCVATSNVCGATEASGLLSGLHGPDRHLKGVPDPESS
jgi:hypothetical protein